MYGELTMHAGGYVRAWIGSPRRNVQDTATPSGIVCPTSGAVPQTTNWDGFWPGSPRPGPRQLPAGLRAFKPGMAPVTDFPPSVWVAESPRDPPVLARVFPSTPEEDIAPDGEMVKPFSNLLWSEDSDTLAFLAKMESSRRGGTTRRTCGRDGRLVPGVWKRRCPRCMRSPCPERRPRIAPGNRRA